MKIFTLLALAALVFPAIREVHAQTAAPTCTSCSDSVAPQVIQAEAQEWFSGPSSTVIRITRQIALEFAALQTWYITDFFTQYWLPAFQKTTAQLSAVAMQQTMIFGAFLDAKQQLETQQLLQRLSARAHKDYQPSIGLCEFGSGAKSLAASERKGEYGSLVMAKRSIDRALGAANTVAAIPNRDKTARFEQFKKKFCDPKDNNGALATVCQAGANTGGNGQESKANKDIDFVRTIDTPWTLKVDFTDGTVDGTDEEEVIALASNLYGSNVFEHNPATNDDNWKKGYMDRRAFFAKRSVAENSYNALVGMKSAGTAGSKDYLKALMQDLGVSSDDATKMIGENPSYYAQMEILTKKIYQNPDFYTNLYDTPVNVARKEVALQAINLMQKFDLFKSYLRNEASLSVLLEIALTEIQSTLENQ